MNFRLRHFLLIAVLGVSPPASAKATSEPVPVLLARYLDAASRIYLAEGEASLSDKKVFATAMKDPEAELWNDYVVHFQAAKMLGTERSFLAWLSDPARQGRALELVTKIDMPALVKDANQRHTPGGDYYRATHPLYTILLDLDRELKFVAPQLISAAKKQRTDPHFLTPAEETYLKGKRNSPAQKAPPEKPSVPAPAPAAPAAVIAPAAPVVDPNSPGATEPPKKNVSADLQPYWLLVADQAWDTAQFMRLVREDEEDSLHPNNFSNVFLPGSYTNDFWWAFSRRYGGQDKTLHNDWELVQALVDPKDPAFAASKAIANGGFYSSEQIIRNYAPYIDPTRNGLPSAKKYSESLRLRLLSLNALTPIRARIEERQKQIHKLHPPEATALPWIRIESPLPHDPLLWALKEMTVLKGSFSTDLIENRFEAKAWDDLISRFEKQETTLSQDALSDWVNRQAPAILPLLYHLNIDTLQKKAHAQFPEDAKFMHSYDNGIFDSGSYTVDDTAAQGRARKIRGFLSEHYDHLMKLKAEVRAQALASPYCNAALALERAPKPDVPAIFKIIVQDFPSHPAIRELLFGEKANVIASPKLVEFINKVNGIEGSFRDHEHLAGLAELLYALPGPEYEAALRVLAARRLALGEENDDNPYIYFFSELSTYRMAKFFGGNAFGANHSDILTCHTGKEATTLAAPESWGRIMSRPWFTDEDSRIFGGPTYDKHARDPEKEFQAFRKLVGGMKLPIVRALADYCK